MALALKYEPAAYRSLLMVAGAVLADPEPMLARLVRGCIALAFTACVLAVACSHSRQGHGELSYMALALQYEPAAYRSLLMVAGAVLADPEPMIARLARGCIALSFTASVFTPPLLSRTWCTSHDPTCQCSVSLELQEFKLRAAHLHCANSMQYRPCFITGSIVTAFHYI